MLGLIAQATSGPLGPSGICAGDVCLTNKAGAGLIVVAVLLVVVLVRAAVTKR